MRRRDPPDIDWNMGTMISEKKVRTTLLLVLATILVSPLLRVFFPDPLNVWGEVFQVSHSILWYTAGGLFAVLAYQSVAGGRRNHAVVFGIATLVFSPFIGVHLPWVFWSVLDVAAIVGVALLTGTGSDAATLVSSDVVGPPFGGVSRLLSIGVFVGPGFGIFYGLFVLTALLGLELDRFFPLNLTTLGIVLTIGVVGSAAFSLFLNIWAIREFRSHQTPTPGYLILPLPYYTIPVFIIGSALLEPHVDMADGFILMALIFGGFFALGVGVALAALLAALTGRRKAHDSSSLRTPSSG